MNRASFFWGGVLVAVLHAVVVMPTGNALATAEKKGGASQPKASIYTNWPFDGAEASRRQGETAQVTKLPEELTLDLGGGVTMKLSLIPAGTFLMGQEEKQNPFLRGRFQHQVAISKPFYLGTYEVTQGQWKAIMGTSPWKDFHRKDIDSYKERGFKPPYPLPEEDPPEGPNYAANYIDWEAATVFCWKLSQKTGKLVRLPTEAEWEYACRAGSATNFCFGDDPKFAGLTDYAWYGENKGASPLNSNRLGQYAHAVGQKRANAWGLYDMHGNVGEWCSDWADDDHDCYYKTSPPVDPQGPPSGVTRVVRGGNVFFSTPAECRSSSRCAGWPGMPLPHDECGFRVVISLDADQATAAYAVAWAQRQLEGKIIGNVRANLELWAWGGLCAKFVANAYGAPGAGADNANQLYAKLYKRGMVRAGAIPDPKDPNMRGALVFWSWKADGHVGIYVGDGKVIHTGRTSPPWVGEDELTEKHDGVIERIGGKYLGYVPAFLNWPETLNPPAVTLIPAPVLLNFGGVVLGTSNELTIDIRNTGKVAVEVTPIVAESKGLKVGANNAPGQGLVRKYGAFEIISPKAESFTLTGGETIGIVVRFSPTAVGSDEAEIHFCRLGSDGKSKVGIASGKLGGMGITGSK